jgi:P27 family predicted phage terminase small subunit
MKGRKAIPDALKKMKGTDQPVRMKNTAQVEAIEKLPPPPKWLPDLAKKLYRMKGKELVNQQIISVNDIDLFLMYCFEYGRYLEATESITKMGNANDQIDSDIKKYRLLEEVRKTSFDRAKSIAVEFGFTPASRSRVNPAGQKEQLTDFQKMMKGIS